MCVWAGQRPWLAMIFRCSLALLFVELSLMSMYMYIINTNFLYVELDVKNEPRDSRILATFLKQGGR